MGLKKKKKKETLPMNMSFNELCIVKQTWFFFLNFVLNTYRVKVFMLGGKRHHFNQSTIRN